MPDFTVTCCEENEWKWNAFKKISASSLPQERKDKIIS